MGTASRYWKLKLWPLPSASRIRACALWPSACAGCWEVGDDVRIRLLSVPAGTRQSYAALKVASWKPAELEWPCQARHARMLLSVPERSAWFCMNQVKTLHCRRSAHDTHCTDRRASEVQTEETISTTDFSIGLYFVNTIGKIDRKKRGEDEFCPSPCKAHRRAVMIA